jgi:hypothetical protein
MKLYTNTQDVTLTKGNDNNYHVVWYVDGMPLRASFNTEGNIVSKDADIVPDYVTKLVEETLFPRSVIATFTDGDRILASYNAADEGPIDVEFFWDSEGDQTSLGSLKFADDEKRRKFLSRMLGGQPTRRSSTLFDDPIFDDIFTGFALPSKSRRLTSRN